MAGGEYAHVYWSRESKRYGSGGKAWHNPLKMTIITFANPCSLTTMPPALWC